MKESEFTPLRRATGPDEGRSACGKKSFTLAEILISLTVIGVIAGMMLPALVTSINEKTWDTGRKALQVRLATALSSMGSLSSYGKYIENKDEGGNITSIEDNAAETFLISGLSKAMKIRTICTSENFKPCHITDKVTTRSGSTIDIPKKLSGIGVRIQAPLKDTKAAAFETTNGESAAVYYNPYCTNELKEYSTTYQLEKAMCINFIYDLNGIKGPNQIGKDMGIITAFYAVSPEVVAPVWIGTVTGVSYDETNTGKDIGTKCSELDPDSVPATIEELSAVYMSRVLTNGDILGNGTKVWTSSVRSSGKNGLAWLFINPGSYGTNNSTAKLEVRSISANAYCIKQ